MAISLKKYVDISSNFPTSTISGRAYGGLAFTVAEPLPQEGDLREAYETYQQGGVVYFGLDEAIRFFGVDSTEVKFANGYYGYMSPSGRFASRLSFAKVLSGETPLAAFTRVNEVTNLFGSFTFLSVQGGGESDADGGIDLSLLKDVAVANSSLDTKYLFVVNSVRGDKSASDVLAEAEVFKSNIKGTVFVSGSTDVSAYMPMALVGSTDYTAGTVINFMFKQFANEEPTVYDDQTYALFNKNFVNFYGRTQTNGQTIDFYQRGNNTDGTDTALYCNEMWFKAECETRLMQHLVSHERIPADNVGLSTVSLIVTNVCYLAVRNGSFMPKSDPQSSSVLALRRLVDSMGGTPEDVDRILQDIQLSGYDVEAVLARNEDQEPIIRYYVFYGTADSIKFIKGDDILVA